MRIALVIERFDPSRGGREKSTAQMAAALARRGQDVTVLCQSAAAAGGEGVEVRELPARGGGRAARLAGFVGAVQDCIGRGGFDIVHATLPVPGANVYQPRGGLIPAQDAASLRRRRGLRRLGAVIARPMNTLRRRLARWERRVIADDSVLCLAVSEMVAREFPHHYARSGRVRVVYNAADVPAADETQRRQWREEFRARVDAGPGAPLFLTVAANFELKGVAEAIEAFGLWAHSPGALPGARLVAVGRKRPWAYRLLAKRHGVGRQVHFLEHTDDVFAWYSAADVCVLLSWYDPCSRVVLEATRWGVPSITTAYNGAAEVLARGAGIVVSSPRPARRVAAAMAELADPARRAECARACEQLADGLSVERHVEELLKAYEEVIASR